MEWQEARNRSLEHWRTLQASLGELDEVDLLREINVVHDLCLKATEQAHGDLHHCNYCIGFQRFGGCQGISLKMSEAVVEKDAQRLRSLVAEFIDQLESLEIPR